jgi:hypothetical protein
MRRSVLQAGAWTALGLAAAFAVVSANSSHRRAATTAAPAAKATVASASSEKCSTNNVCCARDAKVAKAAFAATTPRAVKPKAIAKTPARPVGVNGMVIAIDPETGELTAPTPEQMAGLQQVLPGDDLNNSDVGLTPVRHADGSVSVDLQGRFQEFATIRITPTGQKVFGCTTDPKSLTNPTTPPAPSGLEEK